MKNIQMIITIVVSIFPAQGAMAQEELAVINESLEFNEYEQEQQEYTKIGVEELPISIQAKVAKDYKKVKVVSAFISKDNTYKIALIDRKQNIKYVFAKTTGHWISNPSASKNF